MNICYLRERWHFPFTECLRKSLPCHPSGRPKDTGLATRRSETASQQIASIALSLEPELAVLMVPVQDLWHDKDLDIEHIKLRNF
ncbi:hypothetical protein E2C01_056456 [Portunus trituberculatus]|uniref:Uncharacterized protein n=1 Tax=Portunus trituberculatus TaxID=210409 RepID=A0A5B7GQD5_PORTR|nr:hypothetical protein [Portunus trituberculatus]